MTKRIEETGQVTMQMENGPSPASRRTPIDFPKSPHEQRRQQQMNMEGNKMISSASSMLTQTLQIFKNIDEEKSWDWASNKDGDNAKASGGLKKAL